MNQGALWLIFAAALLFRLSAHAATIGYSTYLGGREYDGLFAVTVDAEGNAFVAGGTSSTNTFPLLDPFQPQFGGGLSDAVIAKFDPQGRLLFSTVLGGSGLDYINALALDAEGNLLFAGDTRSVDLPSTDDAFQYDYAGGSAVGFGDGFVGKMTPDGQRLLYLSYFGGSGDDTITSLASDEQGNVVIAGQTDSKNLPMRAAYQPSFAGGESDGFLGKFDSSLRNLVFSTYLGGGNRDEEQRVAIGSSGDIYVCGQTFSTNFPVTAGAFQTNHVVVPEEFPENSDAFITRLTSDGQRLVYSTYVGDATGDSAFGIQVDELGAAYVVGAISAGWEPGTFPLGFQPEPGYGGVDGWVGKLKPDGSNFEWFSYLGGEGIDLCYGIALDRAGNIAITGITDSRNFPVRESPQREFGGGTQDSFFAKVSADGKTLIYSGYLGGSGDEWGYAVTTRDESGVIFVGQSASPNFPVVSAYQDTNASASSGILSDAYVVQINPTIERPTLRIARSGENVLVSWPDRFDGFYLEAATSAVGDWSRVPGSSVRISGHFVVLQKRTDQRRFYRLRN